MYQAHIYNQEYCGYARKSAPAVDQSKLTILPHKPGTPIPKPSGPKKLPLILKNRHFLDTTFMCVAALNKAQLVVYVLYFCFCKFFLEIMTNS